MIAAQNQKPDTISSGNMVVHNVGISDDPEDQLMILNVLSNTLYTDKVAAVLREYGCNAADANVEAGRGDMPIEVRLPNKLDPTVGIRDFGFGMTEEQILNTFIKLGRSTKRNSNAFTGMLGIGSKAGFAYGDSFLVTSFIGGVKTVYNLFRDKGAPKLVQMFEGPSDSPDGVEVKVPVRMEHMQEFADKARTIYSYFKVRPAITGAKIEWINRDEVFSGPGWRYTGSGKSVAIMGNVGYALNSTGMGLATPSYGAEPPKSETLLNLGVELDFKIGDLEIAANREGLQYSDITKKAVLARLEVAIAEISDIFTKRIAAAKTLWEAREFYHDNFESLETYSRYTIKKLVMGNVLWNGQKITTGEFYVGNKEKDTEVSIAKFTRGGRRNARMGYRTYLNPEDVTASKSVTFIINDLPSKKQSPTRLKGWLSANPNCKTIVVLTYSTAQAQTRHMKLRELEGVPTVLYSAITPLVSVSSGGGSGPSAHKSKHSAKVFALDETKPVGGYHGGAAKSAWWETESVDLKKDSGVYVHIDKFMVRAGGLFAEEHPSEFLQKVIFLRKAGLIKGKVYGFKSDKISALDPKRWVLLNLDIASQMETLMKKDNFAQNLSDSLSAQGYDPLVPVRFRLQFALGTSMRKLLDEYHRMLNAKVSPELRKLVFSDDAKPWLVRPKLPAHSFDLVTQQTQVIKDYPLLQHVPMPALQQASDWLGKNVVDYIRLVESA